MLRSWMLGEKYGRDLIYFANIWNRKWLVKVYWLFDNICIFIFGFCVFILICVFHCRWFWYLICWDHRLLCIAANLPLRCISRYVHSVTVRISALLRLIFLEFNFASHMREIPVHFVFGLHDFSFCILSQMFQFNVGLLLIGTITCHVLRHF